MSQPNITVTAVAASRSLCLLADVKTELGIAASDTSNDARISTLIRAASEYIRSDAELLDGREPWLQTYVESKPGEGGVYLPLSHWPAKGAPTSVTLGTGASPTTVDATTYSVAWPERDRIYRAGGWNLTQREVPKAIPVYGDRDLDYNVTIAAGWVMPDQVSTAWAVATAYAIGDWVQDSADLDYPLIFECTTAGTSHASTEPTWSGAVADGDTVADDGTLVWTAREQRLPDALEVAAKMLVADWFGGFAPANVQFEALESWSIRYMGTQKALSGAVAALVRPYR